MQKEGGHVAFCAGTGVLVFLDLVSHLLLLNKGKAPNQMKEFYEPKFKFVLYVAF